MGKFVIFCALFLVSLDDLHCGVVQPKMPPRGWNSYDCFGAANQTQLFANAAYMKDKLLPHGYEYVVIDAGWFGPSHNDPMVDRYGRLTPDPTMYPEAKTQPDTDQPAGTTASTFKTIADKVHSMGLKFGLWNMFGVPKVAVNMKLPVLDSPYTCDQIIDKSVVCPWWSELVYGLNHSHPGAQAYYASQAKLWGSWGLDFIKVDCIFAVDLKLPDIALLSYNINEEIDKNFVFSLSPGGGKLVASQIEMVSSLVTMARMTADFWDVYNRTSRHWPYGYPSTVAGHFRLAEPFAALIKGNGINGAFPDLDMLPFGRIGHVGGKGTVGPVRETHLTQGEQRIVMAFWSLMKAPLIMGGNLPQNDKFTLGLLTNDAVLALQEKICAIEKDTKLSQGDTQVWVGKLCGPMQDVAVGVFNLGDKATSKQYTSQELSGNKKCTWTNLWSGQKQVGKESIQVQTTGRDVSLYQLADCSS